jgi:hypothetical protein
MAEISKLARQRLAKQAAAKMQSHPDADLLTGFLEQSLTSGERQQVLQHLVFCAECRDVVATALPEESAAQPVLTPAPRQTKWRSLVLVRWGSVAAAVIIAVGAITMYRGQDSGVPNARVVEAPRVAPSVTPPAPTTSEAKKPLETVAKETVAKETARETVPAAKQPQAEVASRSASTESKMKTASAKKDEATSVATSDHGNQGFGRSRTDVGADGGVAGGMMAGSASKPVSPAQSERATESVEVASASPSPASTAGSFASGIAPLSRNRGLPNRASGAASTNAAGNTTSTLPSAPEPNSANMVMADTRTPDAAAPAPNVAGSVATQKSLRSRIFRIDGLSIMPKTYSLAGGSGKSSSPGNSSSTHWKVSELGQVEHSADGGASWTPVSIGDGATFRTVAHSGNQVWAGGDGGVLFHSSNDGATWTRVTVSTLDRALKGDIISIEVSPAQRVKVLTSTDETWSTVDRGLHWDVQ